MKQDDWRAESKLPNGGLRVRHFPTRAVFEVWMDGDVVQAVLRQGAAPSELFEEAKAWFHWHWMFSKDQI
jgi:hypothetical protein